MVFHSNGIQSLPELNALSFLPPIDSLSITTEGNPVTKMATWRRYTIYRISHLSLSTLNGVEVSNHKRWYIWSPGWDVLICISASSHGICLSSTYTKFTCVWHCRKLFKDSTTLVWSTGVLPNSWAGCTWSVTVASMYCRVSISYCAVLHRVLA